MSILNELDKYTKVFIDKGFSLEKKYKIYKGDDIYLLKISPISHINRKNLEVKYSEEFKKKSINHCELLEYKIDDNYIQSIYRWIDGKDFRELANKLSPEEFYNYGLVAGENLKKIHSISVDEETSDWQEEFNKKIDRKILNYKKVEQYYPKGKIFVDYINENRYLLKDREQTLCHGDFHVGNMMIESATKKLYVIDFGTIEIGDPYEEFNRLIWNILFSEDFANGFVDSYFQKSIPQDTWKLITLYMAMDVLSSIPWAVEYGDEQIKIMIDRANKVLEWFDDFNIVVPKFYGKTTN